MLRNKAKRKTSKRAHWSFLLSMIDHFRKKKKKKHKQKKKQKKLKIKHLMSQLTQTYLSPVAHCPVRWAQDISVA